MAHNTSCAQTRTALSVSVEGQECRWLAGGTARWHLPKHPHGCAKGCWHEPFRVAFKLVRRLGALRR
jgi:hypothetical protein